METTRTETVNSGGATELKSPKKEDMIKIFERHMGKIEGENPIRKITHNIYRTVVRLPNVKGSIACFTIQVDNKKYWYAMQFGEPVKGVDYEALYIIKEEGGS